MGIRNRSTALINHKISEDEGDFLEEILREYDQVVLSVRKLGNLYKVESTNQILAVKKISQTNRMQIAMRCMESLVYLKEKEFDRCPQLIPNKYGEQLLFYPDAIYYAYPWIHGYPFKGLRRLEMREAGNLLGRFHSIIEGFYPSAPWWAENKNNEIKKDQVHSWGFWLNQAKDNLNQLPDHENEYFGINKVRENGIKILQWLEPAFLRLQEELIQRGGFCHGDYRGSNLVQASNGLWITDFEHVRFDDRILDLAEFLAVIAKTYRNGINAGISILEGYQKERILNDDEWTIVIGYLLFPNILLQNSTKYIDSNSEETVNKIQTQHHRLQEMATQIAEGIDLSIPI